MQEIPAHPRECHEREIRLWRNCLSLCVSNSCDTRLDSRIARVNVERVLLTLNTVACCCYPYLNPSTDGLRSITFRHQPQTYGPIS